MMSSFIEMAFSVEGLHPKGYSIYTNREGFLFRRSCKTGDFSPIYPRVGNRAAIGNRGAYFYFDVDKETYRVFQDDIDEHGLNARPYNLTRHEWV